MADLIEFGKRVRQLRLARGLTLRSAAAAAGMSHGYVGHIETGRAENPSVRQLEELAGALDAELRVELVPTDAPARPGPPLPAKERGVVDRLESLLGLGLTDNEIETLLVYLEGLELRVIGRASRDSQS